MNGKIKIGNMLRDARNSKNLTMDELADIFNTLYGLKANKSMISRWENDYTQPSMQYLSAYVHFFGIDYNLLVPQADFAQYKSNVKPNAIQGPGQPDAFVLDNNQKIVANIYGDTVKPITDPNKTEIGRVPFTVRFNDGSVAPTYLPVYSESDNTTSVQSIPVQPSENPSLRPMFQNYDDNQKFENLKALDRLKDQGILSEEEYTIEVRKLFNLK